MADIQRTVEIIFGAVDRDVRSTINSIESSLSTFDAGVQGVAQPLASFTDNLLKTEAAIAALGVAMIGFAVNEAAKMQAQVGEIGTLFNGTSEQTEAFTGQIQEFAKSSTQSIESINGAVYSAVSAGIAYNDSLELIAETEKLSVVGRAALDETTKIVVSTLNAYGESADKASDFSDILFTTIQKGQTTLPELNTALGQITGTAAAAEVPFDDLSAAIAALTVSGIPTSQAITGLKAALSNIISPSSEATKTAAALGIEFGVTALRTDGLKGFLDKLKTATGGNIEEMGKFFGSTEALNAVMVLATDRSGNFANALAAMESRTGNVSEAFELMAGNLDLATQKLVNNFTVTAQQVGAPLLDQWTDIVDSLSGVFGGLSIGIGDGAFDDVFKALNSFGSDVENFLNTLAKNFPDALKDIDFSGLLDALGGLGDEFQRAFDGIFGDVDLTTVEGLHSAIQTTINIITSLINVTQGIVSQFTPIFDAIGIVGDKISNTGDDTAIAFGKLLGAAELLAKFGTSLGATLLILEQSQSNIENVFNALAGGGKLFTNSLQIAFDYLAVIISGALSDVTGNIGKFLDFVGADTIASSFRNASESFKDTARGASLSLIDNARDMNSAWDQMADGLTGSSDQASNAVKQVGSGSKQAADGLGDVFAAAAKTANEFLNDKNNADEFSRGLSDLNLSTGITADEFDKLLSVQKDFASATSDTVDESTKLIDQFKSLGGEFSLTADEMKRLSEAGEDVTDAFFDQNGALVLVRDGFGDFGQSAEEAAEAQKKANRAIAEAKDPFKDLSDSQKLAIQNAHEIEKTLLELASNERIRSMEFQVNLNIAQLDAQVKQVESAFQEIGNFYEENTKVIATLTQGFMAGATDKDREFFKEQIAKQLEMEQKVVDSQTNLNESISQLNRAYAQSLTQETLVRIDSNGLDQNIELFMFEVLRRIQTTVVGDRAAFLLGAGQLA